MMVERPVKPPLSVAFVRMCVCSCVRVCVCACVCISKFTDILFSDLCTAGLTRIQEYDVFWSLGRFPGAAGDNPGKELV